MTADRREWQSSHAPLGSGPAPDPGAEPESLVVPMDTGDRIHFLDWGGPSAFAHPPLLLVHDLLQTAWSWAPVARRLRGLAHIVAVDLRGHGLSESPRTGYELDSLAADVLTVGSARGWGSAVGGPAFVIAGHGLLGAAVAASVARLQAESVAGVALVDGGWEAVAAATGTSENEYLAAITEPPEVMASMAAFLADRRAFDPSSWDPDQERALRSQVDEKHAGHVGFVVRGTVLRAVVSALFAYEPDQVIPFVAAPLLAVVAESGNADDEVAPERRLALDELLAARAAGQPGAPARIATFTGSGHNLMRYRPGELSAELLALLEVATG